MPDELSNFFKTVSQGKKKNREELEKFLGEDFFGDNFIENIANTVSKKKKKYKKDIPAEELFEDVIIEQKENQNPIIEKSLGILSEPQSLNNSDPITPIDQQFITFSDLNKHYNLFLSRIQQQLSTLGGGGESNLTYMDVPVAYVTGPSYSISHKDYYIGVNYAGAVTITLPRAEREGKIFIVKDELGEASRGTNRYITILPSGNDLIDGRDRAILAFDYGSLTFIWRGNSWRVV
jgi:hypothetical protein